mmetsp:Transcript_23118/g.50279  ORF Transcript_23118/g.50279 Transcript_23118/m.50279 type:complete len:115 (+) Transcript_23118:92-436(+)
MHPTSSKVKAPIGNGTLRVMKTTGTNGKTLTFRGSAARTSPVFRLTPWARADLVVQNPSSKNVFDALNHMISRVASELGSPSTILREREPRHAQDVRRSATSKCSDLVLSCRMK